MLTPHKPEIRPFLAQRRSCLDHAYWKMHAHTSLSFTVLWYYLQSDASEFEACLCLWIVLYAGGLRVLLPDVNRVYCCGQF